MKIKFVIIAFIICRIANAQWTAVNTGLTDYQIHSLAVNGTTIFAGTHGWGLFLSTDNGGTWTHQAGLARAHVSALAISDTTIFAGAKGEGIYLSADNGGAWTDISNGLSSNDYPSIAINDSSIFVGTYGNGIWRSTNNGASWVTLRIDSNLLNHYVNAIVVSGTSIFAGTNGGIFLSTNNGNNWKAMNVGLTPLGVSAIAINGTNIFAGTNSGIFLSVDNGSTWTAMNTGLTYLRVLAVAISGTTIFAGTEEALFVSRDNGNSWSLSLDFVYVNAIAINGTNVFVGTDNSGVFVNSSLLDVKEISDSVNSLVIYPSPGNGIFKIQSHNEQVNEEKFEILNIFSEKVPFNKNNDQVDISDQPNGVYFIRFYTGRYVLTKKIVIEK